MGPPNHPKHGRSVTLAVPYSSAVVEQLEMALTVLLLVTHVACTSIESKDDNFAGAGDVSSVSGDSAAYIAGDHTTILSGDWQTGVGDTDAFNGGDVARGGDGLSGHGLGDSDASQVEPDPLELTFGQPPFNLGGTPIRFASDIAYGAHGRNVFDIALPVSATSTALIVYIHGGGFLQGDKSAAWSTAELGEALLAGVAVASINYRYLDVVDNEGVIKPMTDSAHALQFIRYHASSTFNIDRQRVAIFGSSAGAGTALWLAFHDDLADSGHIDPVRRMSTRPQAVAVNETQASYNVARWSDDVFIDYSSETGDFIDYFISLSSSQRLLSLYGIDTLEALDDPSTLEYRANVDMLALMDSEDIGFWTNSSLVPLVLPSNTSELFHHAHHARELIEVAQQHGLTTVAYVPVLGVVDESGQGAVDYLLERLGSTP